MPWIFRSLVLRHLDRGWPWVAAQLGPHTWRRNTKQGQVWCSRRVAVMLRRTMPEPFVRSTSSKRLTRRRLLIVSTTYAMEVMNLSHKVRQHSFRNPAPDKIVPRTNSLCWCKNALVFFLLLNFCNLHSKLHCPAFQHQTNVAFPNFPAMGNFRQSRKEQFDFFVHFDTRWLRLKLNAISQASGRGRGGSPCFYLLFSGEKWTTNYKKRDETSECTSI